MIRKVREGARDKQMRERGGGCKVDGQREKYVERKREILNVGERKRRKGERERDRWREREKGTGKQMFEIGRAHV